MKSKTASQRAKKVIDIIAKDHAIFSSISDMTLAKELVARELRAYKRQICNDLFGTGRKAVFPGQLFPDHL